MVPIRYIFFKHCGKTNSWLGIWHKFPFINAFSATEFSRNQSVQHLTLRALAVISFSNDKYSSVCSFCEFRNFKVIFFLLPSHGVVTHAIRFNKEMESISFVHWYECNELTHCDLNKKVILIIVIISNVKMTTFDNYFIIDYIQLHSCKLIMVITPAHTTSFNCLFMRILSSIQIP